MNSKQLQQIKAHPTFADIRPLLKEVEWLRGLIATALPHLKHRGWYSKAREILEEALEDE